jgi:hypothetical protein
MWLSTECWNLSRREFVLSMMVVTAGGAVALGTSAAHATERRVHTIIARSGAAAEAFRDACTRGMTLIHVDVGPAMRALEGLGQPSGSCLVFGLTRDIEYLLLQQIGLEQGFRPIYRAAHTFRDGHTEHQLHASPEVATALASRLQPADRQWSAALAGAVDLVGESTHLGEPVALRTADAHADRADLVSWAMRREAVRA